MSDRCDLCGAKVRPEDEFCRECGAPQHQFAAENSAITEIDPLNPSETTGTSAQTHPDLPLEPRKRRTAAPILISVAVLAAVGIGLGTTLRSGASAEDVDSTPPAREVVTIAAAETPPCAAFEPLAGHWEFVTEVTGSRVVRSSGLHGFYSLDVTVDACRARASLTKTGYSGRAFSERRIQTGTAELQLGTEINAELATGTFELASDVGAHGTVEFSFLATGDGLSGVYRQRGARWNDAGLSGFLRGTRRATQKHELQITAEPCLTRCHIGCGTAIRDGLDATHLQTCVDHCEANPAEPAQCGDATALPHSYALTLEGPSPRATVCKAVGGCTPIPRRGTTEPRLGAERLPNGWHDVAMVRAKKDGGVHILLHGPRGWWRSDALFAPAKGSALGKLRLYARDLADSSVDRYVLGLARESPSESSPEVYVACRLSESPSCLRVPKARHALVAALPEGNLVIGPDVADPDGIFNW